MAVLLIPVPAEPRKAIEPDGVEVLSPLSEQVMNFSRTNRLPHGRWENLPTKKKGMEETWQHSPALTPP